MEDYRSAFIFCSFSSFKSYNLQNKDISLIYNSISVLYKKYKHQFICDRFEFQSLFMQLIHEPLYLFFSVIRKIIVFGRNHFWNWVTKAPYICQENIHLNNKTRALQKLNIALVLFYAHLIWVNLIVAEIK